MNMKATFTAKILVDISNAEGVDYPSYEHLNDLMKSSSLDSEIVWFSLDDNFEPIIVFREKHNGVIAASFHGMDTFDTGATWNTPDNMKGTITSDEVTRVTLDNSSKIS